MFSMEDCNEIFEMLQKKKIFESYNFPNKPSSDDFYHINVKDPTKKNGRKQIKAKTLEKLKEKVYAYEKGLYGNTRKTVKDVFECVCNEKLSLAKGEKLISRENTVRRNRQDYVRYFANTEFEKMYVDQICAQDIFNFAKMNLTRYDLKLKAYNNLKGILKSIFELSFQEYWISEPVYQRVKFNNLKGLLVEETPISERAYSDIEIAQILDYVHEQQHKYPCKMTAWALEMQILMGDRIGEVPPIRWSDICHSSNNISYIFICREQLAIDVDGKTEFKIVNHTKTYKKREFPINKNLNEFLLRLKIVHDKYLLTTDYLFPAKNDMHNPITKKQIKDFFDYSIKSLRLQKKGITLGTHSFRRNAISKTLEKTNGNYSLTSEIYGNSPITAAKNYKLPYDIETKYKALG